MPEPVLTVTPAWRPAIARDIPDPRSVLRYVLVGRSVIATAIFAATVTRWLAVGPEVTLVASLAFAGAVLVTAFAWIWQEVWGRPLTRGFLYAQALFDLGLVTAVVHVTGGWLSPFSALYVLVIAVAAVWLPIGSTLLVAVTGIALYGFDVFVLLDAPVDPRPLMQAGVFAVTALGSGVIAERLRRAGAAQAELREALVQVRLQAEDVLRALESGIITVDGTGHLLYANPAASRLLGLDLMPRIGRPVLDDVRSRAPIIADALARTVADGTRTLRADGTITRNGTASPVGLTTTAVGDPTGAGGRSATAIFQDLTDMRRAEQLSRAAQRLEAITELAASLAHEIRNPLAAIRSAVEQLAARVAAGEDERALSRLIVRESDRLSRLLGEFLDFSRVREAKLAPTDVAALVRHVADLARSHPEHGAAVEVRTTGADAPFLADVDDDLLMRALLNLALNALQVMPERGTLTIGLVESDGRDLPPMARVLPPPIVRITVEDTGPGLADEVRERLFQPFITTRPGGHGLGLPMVHRAVEAHRGIVSVESAPGRTCFTLCLPRRAGAA